MNNLIDKATQEEIQQFLHGNDPEKYIVALEYGWRNGQIYKIKEYPVVFKPDMCSGRNNGVKLINNRDEAINLLKTNKRQTYIVQKLYNSKSVKKNFKVSSSIEIADIYIIAVPTPITNNKKANLSFVHKAFKNISTVLKKGDLILLESTCPIGTTKKYCNILKKFKKRS